MGHRDIMKGGDEWDHLTQRGRYYTRKRHTKIADTKRRFNKRIRKAARNVENDA